MGDSRTSVQIGGSALQPPQDWQEWVSPTRTRNWLIEDPLLDWLESYGEAAGFKRDALDPETSFLAYRWDQGKKFEAGVLDRISETLDVVEIGADPKKDVRDASKIVETIEAMRRGVAVIAQAILWDPVNRTHGSADLLMRSDRINELIPETLTAAEAAEPAPLLDRPWHYRAVDIKFRTFKLGDENICLDRSTLPYRIQVYLYNEALLGIQGYRPRTGYLLGRNWEREVKGKTERGTGCFDRLARIDCDGKISSRSTQTYKEAAEDALAWVRRLRSEGSAWHPTRAPILPELFPNMKNHSDEPWTGAKKAIAKELEELTMLPGVTVALRKKSHANGLTRWSDPAVSSISLDVGAQYRDRCDRVLDANRASDPVVLPLRIDKKDDSWRVAPPLELFVDFETVSNLNDDFSTLPAVGGQEMIFQIGAGYWEKGRWVPWQATADRLTEAEEAQVIDSFITYLDELCLARGLDRKRDVRLVHWSAAETSTFQTAYNSARLRHAAGRWPDDLPWYDFLDHVVHSVPVTVTGSFGFGLKAIAKAMYEAKFIERKWEDGPTDGLGAQVAAWRADDAARQSGRTMSAVRPGLMKEVERYNLLDRQIMSDVVRWLRANR